MLRSAPPWGVGHSEVAAVTWAFLRSVRAHLRQRLPRGMSGCECEDVTAELLRWSSVQGSDGGPGGEPCPAGPQRCFHARPRVPVSRTDDKDEAHAVLGNEVF